MKWYVVNRGEVIMMPLSGTAGDSRDEYETFYFFGSPGDRVGEGREEVLAVPVDFATKAEASSFAREFGGFAATFIPRRKK